MIAPIALPQLCPVMLGPWEMLGSACGGKGNSKRRTSYRLSPDIWVLHLLPAALSGNRNDMGQKMVV